MSSWRLLTRRPIRTMLPVALITSAGLSLGAAPAFAAHAAGRDALISSPGVPMTLSGTAASQKVLLTWTPPSNTGGLPIDHYELTQSSDGGRTWSAPVEVNGTSDTVKALTNGTSYEFQVAANNTYATGSAATSAALVPHGPLDYVSLTPPAEEIIDFGGSTALTTTLTDTTTSKPIGSATVDLMARPPSKTEYHAIASPKTKADGSASVTVTPKANTRYRWSYSGDSTHRSALTNFSDVLVNEVVTASLSSSAVKHHKVAEVWGMVKPATVGEGVILQARQHGTWTSVGDPAKVAKQKLPDGKKKVGYVLEFTPAKKGTEKLRVDSHGTHENQESESTTLTLKVT